MDKPVIYKDWVDLLDQVAAGTDDDKALELMQQGTLYWQIGVANRFLNVLVETVNVRIQRIQNDMNKKFSRSTQENELVSEMLFARKQYDFLEKLVSIPAIPEEQQKNLLEMIRNNRHQLQSSLEDSVKNEPSGKMLSILRNNKLG